MATNKSNSTVTDLDTKTPDVAAQEAAKAEAGVVLKGSNADSELSGDKVVLTIHSDGSDNGQDAVQLSHNSFMYLVPRNKPVIVPKEVAWVIRDAMVTQYKTGDGGKTTESDVPRYAYQISPV
jgi:hypothetical protein